MRLNSAESISRARARGGPTEVSRQSESFLPTPIAFPAADRIISLRFTAFPSLPPPAEHRHRFAPSLRLPLATRFHCSCNFHASKATDTPRDGRSPSSTANFSSFCLNGTVATATAAGTPRLNESTSPMKKMSTRVHGVTWICHKYCLQIFHKA